MFQTLEIWGFQKWGNLQNGWLMEKSVKMDDLGVPHDLGNLDIYNNDSTI